MVLTTSVADRKATVRLPPEDGHVTVEIGAPTTVLTVSLDGVDRVEASISSSGTRALSITIHGRTAEQTFVLRTSPEIDFRST